MDEMLAEILKEVLLGEIEKGFREASKEWIHKWARNEVSGLDDFILPHVGDLRKNKGIALQVAIFLTEEDILRCAARARPDLEVFWNKRETLERINHELTSIRNYLSSI